MQHTRWQGHGPVHAYTWNALNLRHPQTWGILKRKPTPAKCRGRPAQRESISRPTNTGFTSVAGFWLEARSAETWPSVTCAHIRELCLRWGWYAAARQWQERSVECRTTNATTDWPSATGNGVGNFTEKNLDGDKSSQGKTSANCRCKNQTEDDSQSPTDYSKRK